MNKREVILTTTEQLKEALTELLPDALIKAKNRNPAKIYTIPQVARLLEKDPRTIRRMIRESRIQATTDKKHISQQAIENYLNENQ